MSFTNNKAQKANYFKCKNVLYNGSVILLNIDNCPYIIKFKEEFMKNHLLKVLAILIVSILITSCTKDDDPGQLTLHFNHFFNDEAFKADTSTTHILNNGEELIFQRFQYYITNIRLQSEDGTWWSEEESYHIVNAGHNNPQILLDEVPTGTYTEVSYMIGVDSMRNFSGAQDGALSPSNALFWSWNTGYIFLAVEGRCSSCPENNPFFIHHIGGFKSPYQANRVNTQELPDKLVMKDGSDAAIDFRVQVNELYEGNAIQLDFEETQTIHSSSETTRLLSENYAAMFTVSRVVN